MSINKPKVMMLGTFHFQGSTDIVQADTGNLMSKQKQIEIEEVIDKLSKYEPTKIAVEVEKMHNGSLNKNYHDYMEDTFDLSVNEIHQLGFKLGKFLNLENIYGIDWMENIGQKSINEVLDWASENQIDLYNTIINDYISKLDINFNDLTILEALKKLNNKEFIKFNHQLYMQVSKIGNDNEYIGIDWVRWWYQRNLIIYKNIVSLIESSDERIVLIIGSGHIHLVTQFLLESGEVTIIDPNNFL